MFGFRRKAAVGSRRGRYDADRDASARSPAARLLDSRGDRAARLAALRAATAARVDQTTTDARDPARRPSLDGNPPTNPSTGELVLCRAAGAADRSARSPWGDRMV